MHKGIFLRERSLLHEDTFAQRQFSPMDPFAQSVTFAQRQLIMHRLNFFYFHILILALTYHYFFLTKSITSNPYPRSVIFDFL